MSATYTKTIICFANSRKMSGRCVAGKEIDGPRIGRWIRPVSDSPTGELDEIERRFNDGSEPALLDVITMDLRRACPHHYQTENHLIDRECYWIRERQASWTEVREALDQVSGPLWLNGSSTNKGLNDRVSLQDVETLYDSLKLIEVVDLLIVITVEGIEFNNPKRKIRGQFSLGTIRYRLTITDPIFVMKYSYIEEGLFEIGRAILCVSLGEAHTDGYAYKLIAAVITKSIGL